MAGRSAYGRTYMVPTPQNITPFRGGGERYKDFSGLGIRSIFYLYSSVVGNTFTFDVAEDTASNLSQNVSIIEALAGASLGPQILKRGG